MIRNAKVTVYEKGQEFKPSLMTEPEVAAILECIHELFRTYGTRIYFDATVDEEEDTLVIHCYEETPDGKDSHWIPFPKEWEAKAIPMSNRRVFNLIGDKIPITPRQLGLSPWNFVEIKITNYDDE